MKNRTLKKDLLNNKATLGCWLTLAHPGIAEIMANAGFDWIAIDLEHSVITIKEAEELIHDHHKTHKHSHVEEDTKKPKKTLKTSQKSKKIRKK